MLDTSVNGRDVKPAKSRAANKSKKAKMLKIPDKKDLKPRKITRQNFVSSIAIGISEVKCS